MSFVSASEGRGLETGQPPAGTADARRLKVRPLAGLWPYVARYRLRALAAFGALFVAALATLAVPIAVRRMIDFGFSPQGVALIDNYFAVMIAVVALLAVASAMRYYLVTTLGERIVADLRSDVFAHLTALSPAFFDRAQTGEMMSRLTADTTQIKSAVGASVSIALRNVVLFLGAGTMMVVTSPQAVRFRARRDPDHRAAARRLRPLGAPAFARSAGHARRRLRLCRRTDRRGAHAAGLHQRTACDNALFRGGRSRAFVPRAARRWRARCSPPSRSSLSSPASSSCSGSARRTCLPERSRPAGSASSCSTRSSPPGGSAN